MFGSSCVKEQQRSIISNFPINNISKIDINHDVDTIILGRALCDFPTSANKLKTTRLTGKLIVSFYRLAKSKKSFLGNCISLYLRIIKNTT